MENPYNQTVRELFAEPAHGGTMTAGTDIISVQVGDRAAGSEIVLAARVDDGQVRDMRFLAWGCPHLLAACEYSCRKLCGRSATELAPLPQNELIGALDLPVEKTGQLLLIEDAINALKNRMKYA